MSRRTTYPSNRHHTRGTGVPTEDRIRRRYAGERRSSWWHEYGVGAFWLMMARWSKRSVQDVKRICLPHRYVQQ